MRPTAFSAVALGVEPALVSAHHLAGECAGVHPVHTLTLERMQRVSKHAFARQLRCIGSAEGCPCHQQSREQHPANGFLHRLILSNKPPYRKSRTNGRWRKSVGKPSSILLTSF